MSSLTIQGDWDDLVLRTDLRGRKVRITVIDEVESDNPWIKSLRAWADSHQPLNNTVDDSRESIYPSHPETTDLQP